MEWAEHTGLRTLDQRTVAQSGVSLRAAEPDRDTP